ncbi:MAG TPA: RecQ family ATP-dependent DNA helicase [Bacteroidales bacterium]|nr:RecQ family ATP-dependent DNA helicase [Bacteroidales bacterium]
MESVYKDILKKYWGYSSFRPMQEDIIKSICSGRDTLALLPTGGGKSVTFQVPALALEGICLVITPLIALMKEQVSRLNSMSVKALGIHSGMTSEEIDIAIENSIYGNYKFLYVSPERLSARSFSGRLSRLNLSFIAVDEAHCISQWGYDFRPSYLRIAELRDQVDERVPFLALTATATGSVIDDIMEKLRFRERNVMKTSFARPNITYLVRKVEDKEKYVLKTLKKAKGSGIIYVRSRKRTREIAEMLIENGISADYYHAGLKDELRDNRQVAWTNNEKRIIVSTNAFGMGIDKPDVRFVIHWDIPDSIENYFQESGRAGRDGIASSAVLLVTPSDKNRLTESIKKKFPPIEKIKDIYDALCNYLQIPIGSGKEGVFDFNIADFVSKYRLPVTETVNSLQFLQREGYIEFTGEFNNPSRVHFIVGRDDLYKFQVSNESFDNFIKLLLRSYTGLFSEFVSINESELSRRSGISKDTIYQYLVKLAQLHIINFIPGKKTSLVILKEERLMRKALKISTENYLDVKNRYSERLSKMIEYTDHSEQCRQAILLKYFNEVIADCGKCDTCKSKAEQTGIADDLESCNRIKELLLISRFDISELVDTANMPEEKVIRAVRLLLDNDEVYYLPDKKLALKKD